MFCFIFIINVQHFCVLMSFCNLKIWICLFIIKSKDNLCFVMTDLEKYQVKCLSPSLINSWPHENTGTNMVSLVCFGYLMPVSDIIAFTWIILYTVYAPFCNKTHYLCIYLSVNRVKLLFRLNHFVCVDFCLKCLNKQIKLKQTQANTNKTGMLKSQWCGIM